MKPKLIIIFLLLVLSPLALLAWLGYRAAADEQARVQSTIAEAYANQLTSLRSVIHETVTEREREFSQLLARDTINRTDSLRALVRQQRFVRQVFVIGPDGKFSHPPANESLRTGREREFFERTNSIWLSGEKFDNSGESNPIAPTQDATYTNQQDYQQSLQNEGAFVNVQRAVQQTPQYNAAPVNFVTNQGWYTWFHGDGAQIIFWQHFPEINTSAGIEVDREALMAEVIAKLPTDSGAGAGSIVLTDASARAIYQWGGAEPMDDEIPNASIPLFAPLGMWHLNHFASATAPTQLGKSSLLSLTSGIIAAAVAVLALATYFYRENSREMRAAAEKVSFVNQVSHELKTPLTNIRMYAELAEGKIPAGEDNGAKRCLDIVVNESQRLSRLIGNVLTFAKPKAQEPNPTANIPDQLIGEALDHFRPALAAQDIEITSDLDAKKEVKIDADILEQILGNLLSNVEKYAAGGKALKITSTQSAEETTITVSDSGPGIPKNQREKIFRAFHRLSNKNSDGVSGTGIGLTIARDLARKHGGDLTLANSPTGCAFILTLAGKMNEEV